jgi:hypothetical protein
MKSDNGSAFKGAQTQGTLLDWKVFSLLSPQAIPEYNGSVEPGGGKLKIHSEWEAERNGRAGQWTSDDVEAARLISNQTPRRAGQSYVTPQTLWNSRSPITDHERSEFARTVDLCRPQALRHYGLSADTELTSKEKDAIDRFAVSRALVALGYLSFTRRRITPPFKSVFRAKIR